jgi:MoxR-like ATPase
LAIRLAEAEGDALGADDLFRRDFLVERPLLRAVEHAGPLPAVLLIDEIDRADEHFEAFLLELLAERAITVPEIGTISAAVPPIAVLTSNRTRDLHDALKRRCLYHWIDHPKLDQVVAIVRERVPGATEALAVQVSAAAGRLRTLDLQKSPGTAEVIDWVQALHVLGLAALDESTAATTLGSVLKYREDRDVAVGAGLAWVVGD